MQQTVTFIGGVSSPIKSIDDCPLQEDENAPAAPVIILPEFIDGMKDIAVGQQLLLLTWLNLADRTVLTCYPRNNQSLPLTGVFSTRSPDRPNPIGLHVVTVLSVEPGGIINVAGLEVLDQTPVVDIKPVRRNQVGI